MVPFRDDLWNLPEWMYTIHWIVVIVCGALVVYGLWRRVRLWREGGPALRTDRAGRRIGGLLLYALAQRRVLAQAYPGLMHGLIFYGFVVFFIATSLVGIQMDLHLLILQGPFYLVFEAVVNAFALLFLIGLGLAALRRYILRPDRLNIRRDDAYVLGSLAFIALTGLTLEVMRLRGQQPPWADWSWLGNALSRLFGPRPEQPPAIYPFVWWTHQLTTFFLIATLPYHKFLHIVTGPVNIYLRRLDTPGALPKIEDIETTEEPLGVGSIPQFTWKQLLDGDACMECGRCQAACPAERTGKSLNPRLLVHGGKRNLFINSQAMWNDRRIDSLPPPVDENEMPVALIGDQLGFAEATHFVKFFRRETGLTPGAFRAEQRSQGSRIRST